MSETLMNHAPSDVSILALLHWLTDLAQEADSAKSLGLRGFQDEVIPNHFGQFAEQCIQLRAHLLDSLCSSVQRDCFWSQQTMTTFQSLPESYLLEYEQLEQVRLKMTPPPPVYKLRLLGKALDLFRDLTHFERALWAQIHDQDLREHATEPIFAAYYAIRDTIEEGRDFHMWGEMHDGLDLFAGNHGSTNWRNRWRFFCCRVNALAPLPRDLSEPQDNTHASGGNSTPNS